MFYNRYRSTSKTKTTAESFNGSRSLNPTERLINLQKREKLKGLLITKFMKKYGIKNPEIVLEEEISKFIAGEKLTDADLKRLDEKIRSILQQEKTRRDLRQNLTNEQTSCNNQEPNNDRNETTSREGKVNLPDLNKGETMSVHSKMSGASHLSKFNEKNAKHKHDDEDDFDNLSISSRRPQVNRLDFTNEGDEWNAICQYNKKLYEEEKINNRMKDAEIKLRTKMDLDNQVQQKLMRLYEEKLKNQEYDQITLNHVAHLNQIEYQKLLEHKKKVLREKENRDKQLKDEKIRKKIEIVKEKKYEKQLVKHLLEEIEKEKNIMLKKKLEEKAALQKTLKDNELNKIKQLELLKKEREDDVRACEEYSKVLEKQENERIEYFKKIERNANGFMTKMVDTVLKDMQNKNKEEDERMKAYLAEKEKREQEEEQKKLDTIRDNKRQMRQFLDMQVVEKTKMKEFEKTLDKEQANIWKIDTRRFYDQEKEINDKVRLMHTHNAGNLKSQIEARKLGKTYIKMTDEEYALNRKLLETMKNSSA